MYVDSQCSQDILAYSMAYSVTCPEKSHWQILSKYICTHARNYTCLLDILTLEYRQNCRGPKIIAPGSKYVWQPNFNRGECDAERYQPFIFNTDGYTKCSFLKSRCNNEGHATFINGSAKMDRSCYCDGKRGYLFVSSTHENYCIPSEEDCSCYKNVTEGITKIYNTDQHSVDNTIDHSSEQLQDANNNRAIEDDEQKDIESGTSCEMVKRQNVLTGLDKCILKRYISNLDNTEIIEFASILRHKGLISKSAYSYIELCYKNHNYHNMRSAAIRNSTEMPTDLRNVVFVMYNLDSKYKSWAGQLYKTFKNVLELRPLIVY
ncbi:unnamed protein product [Mytilus edulis]|uniref:Uncharacterized protein n=1 Tax=Mytilus edulis TaxID=6550 RepID=A0A8S3UC14_MYTED|nr:unnamed protein product [Mytilus edulis]